MAYADAFDVDDLVSQKTRFVNKVVVLNGKLVEWRWDGIIRLTLVLTLQGEKRQIKTSCLINRVQGEHRKLEPHLRAYLGETIGVKVFADAYTITAMKFGHIEFLVKAI